MDKAINYDAVILQLQLENELLKNRMKTFMGMRNAIGKIPDAVGEIWQKMTASKYRLLVGLMIIYWAVSIGFMFYDRFKGDA